MPALSSAKHERFAQLVAEGKTGVDAYLEAGHKVDRKVAGVNASRLLKKPDIKARIEELLAQRLAIEETATAQALTVAAEELGLSKERILREMSAIAFASPEDMKQWGAPGPKHLATKLTAQTNLGKHLGLFKELHEHSGPDGGPIQITRIERVIVDPADQDPEGVPAPAGTRKVQGR